MQVQLIEPVFSPAPQNIRLIYKHLKHLIIADALIVECIIPVKSNFLIESLSDQIDANVVFKNEDGACVSIVFAV